MYKKFKSSKKCATLALIAMVMRLSSSKSGSLHQNQVEIHYPSKNIHNLPLKVTLPFWGSCVVRHELTGHINDEFYKNAE